jgi:putative SOS response-associated peptidase YedK
MPDALQQLRRIAPEPNPFSKKKDMVWFALNDDRPLAAFAGIWTEYPAIGARTRTWSTDS